MSDKFKRAFRGYLIDHHSPAPPTVDFTRLDPAEYERFYQEADISNLMVYTKDHWGYSYYDTKIGTRHPGLRTDYIADVSAILRRRGIEFNAYYCLEYDTLAPLQHPEWAIRDRWGRPVSLRGRMAKWGMPCYETGYRQYVLGQLSEVVERYRPDSLFLDIFGKTLCYCDACRKKFRARYGYDLPESDIDPQDEFQAFDFGEKGRDVNEFLEDSAQDMLSDIISTVKAIDPGIKVTINFSALYPKKIRDMLDYQFTEPWAGNWLSAAYSRDTARGQYPQLGPGDVSEVYNYRPDTVYRLAAAQIVANGCRSFMYSGSQHVDGTLEHEEARRVGRAYREVEALEPYLGERETVADVAILQSDSSSRARSGNQVIVNSIGRCKRSDAHRAALLGAMKLCDWAKCAWRVVPEQELTPETARGFKLIILAGAYHITPEVARVLRDYVREGGRVLAAGECGLYGPDGEALPDFAIGDLLGCRYVGRMDGYANATYGGYLRRDDSPAFRLLPDTLPPLGSVQYAVAPTGGRAHGEIVEPCTPLTETTWVNWWCPPPAVTGSGRPAIIDNAYGEGRVLYAAFDMFTGVNEGLNLMRQMFAGMLELLMPAPALRLITGTPESVSFAAYRRGSTLIVHLVSHMAELTGGDAPELPAGVLTVGAELGRVLSARTLEGDALEVREYSRESSVSLPGVSIHRLVLLELGEWTPSLD